MAGARARWAELLRFPWRATAETLLVRFREDHMALTASSLTFTTSIALVPFFTVALAVFTAFPMFSTLQGALQAWLVQSLIPDNIARQVLGYLTQFSSQANKLGIAGLGVLLVTAIALILTIDRTLNAIWRVKNSRPLAQRVLTYWGVITLGPLLLAMSLALTSYVLSRSAGLVGVLPASLRLLLDVVQFLLVAAGMATLYRYVPNTFVRWRHAWAGGIFVAAGIGLAKKLLSYYLTHVPTYSLIYGAFATLPILLVWIYLAWIVVLFGAVIAAYYPSLLSDAPRRGGGHGWHFQLSLEVLQQLEASRRTTALGQTPSTLAQALQVDVLQLTPVLEALRALHWVAELVDQAGGEARFVLLADPDTTLLEPLIERFLLTHCASTQQLWEGARLNELTLRQAL